MRVFNPEKELRKIQKGNKNKVILGVCLLLLIVAIGSSYALYQIKYNKRIIYTTVDKFYSKDIQLAVYVDNKKQEDFPSKEEGYLYEGIECENEDITASFNSETWKLELKLDKPNRCNIKFTSNPFKAAICKDTEMSECLLKKELQYNKELAFDDPDSNARYYGKEPANYIWFNCDDYSAPSEETCERWRIIGSFKNIEKVNADETTTKENLVKIIRADSIGLIAWDSSNKNNWAEASLQKGLNGPYLEKTDDGTWITEAEYTSIVGSNTRNDNYKGITANTKEMIEKVRWNIGGPEEYIDSDAAQFYEEERGILVSPGLPTTWDGYIGLIYPSDYAYATSGLEGNETTNRNGCLNSALYTWNKDDYRTNCAGNSWLLSRSQWVIMPIGWSCACVTHIVGGTGLVYQAYTTTPYIVRPTLYLKSNVKVLSGDGTYESPYVLST